MNYFVGQRVRHVGDLKPYKNPVANDLIGKTGRLQAKLVQDGWWEVELDAGDYNIEAHQRVLEPILPDGHRPAEQDVHELLPFLKDQVAA